MTSQNESDENDKKNALNAFNESLLSRLKSRSGSETVRWINNLKEDGSPNTVKTIEAEADTQAVSAQGIVPANEMVRFIDGLFDLFQQYEVEFNRLRENAQLHIETERPIFDSDLLQRLQKDEHSRFSGRLHVHGWSLLVRGNLSRIEAFVLPSDHFIAFSANEAAYNPLFQATFVWDKNELKWDIDGHLVKHESLPTFAKQLFGHLVKIGKNEVSESEPFVFIRSRSVGAGADSSVRGNVFEEGNPLLSPLAPARAANNFSAQTNALDVDEAFAQLLSALDKELELLSGKGAEFVLQKSAKLKSLREQIQSAVNEWKKLK